MRSNVFSGAADGLVGRDGDLAHAEFFQRMQRGHIGLQRAVALHGDEAAFGAEAFSLRCDDLGVLGIDFGYDHGHGGG